MVLATSILIPLYLYPTPGAWNWATNAIAANPSLPFTIIVNPDSGPGATNAYPEAEYIAGVTNLTQYDNVKLLGYVDTKYMAKTTAAVGDEVETYKYWSTYTKGNIAVSGIFFDDAVDTWTSDSSSYMTTIANNAHALNLTVTFNPGTIAASQFFDIADRIVMIEDSYSAYSSGTGDSLAKITSTVEDKSSVILYDFSGSETEQTTMVNDIVGKGVAEVYITTVEYTSESGLWTQFVEAVSGAVGSVPAAVGDSVSSVVASTSSASASSSASVIASSASSVASSVASSASLAVSSAASSASSSKASPSASTFITSTAAGSSTTVKGTHTHASRTHTLSSSSSTGTASADTSGDDACEE